MSTVALAYVADLSLVQVRGVNRSSDSKSGRTILAAFVPVFIIALLYLAIFVAIRSSYLNIYAPRTFMGTIPERDRTPSGGSNGAKWFRDFRRLPDSFVLKHSSLDAYLYLRFLRFVILVCFVGSFVTWPTLLPVNATGGGTASQLDRISFSNIAINNRLWAHVIVAVVFLTAVILLVARERLWLIGARQAYLLHKINASRVSSKTVLFLHAPREAQPASFGKDAVKIWPVKSLDGELLKLVEQRNNLAYKLESAEVALAQQANEIRIRRLKTSSHESPHSEITSLPASRPQQRLSLIPGVGASSDTIYHSRTELVELIKQISKARQHYNHAPMPDHCAVFVTFSTQEAAIHAYEKLSFEPKLPIEHRYIGVQPKEILWETLTWSPAIRASKASLALLFIIVFIVFFSIPVGIIGTLSNVKYLANNVKWLNFINDLPPIVLGLLQGLLPPLLIGWFIGYVPKLFRHIAELSGEPTTSQAELKTQAWFFTFSVVQVFLVTTFSSGAAAVVFSIIQDPASAPMLLAQSLPKASNFYLTYFVIQGTASAADAVLNYSDLLEYLFYKRFMTKTPRDKYSLYVQMKGINYGKLYPKFTNLCVIAIAYSCIAPLLLGFATIGISLYYVSYRYQIFYTAAEKIDTKGECYKRALQQMMTGVYLSEICLIGLFGAREAPGPAAIMIAFLVMTAVANFFMDRMLRPLELYLGIDHWQEQEVPLLAEEEGISQDNDEALQVASHNRRLGVYVLPKSLANPISAFAESIVSTARTRMKSWLHDPSAGPEDSETVSLSEAEMDKMYLNPALTSETPKLWLAKDDSGMSRHEIEELRALNILATDEGAFFDAQNRVQWEKEDFSKVPIFKVPTRY